MKDRRPLSVTGAESGEQRRLNIDAGCPNPFQHGNVKVAVWIETRISRIQTLGIEHAVQYRLQSAVQREAGLCLQLRIPDSFGAAVKADAFLL